jgi:flagellar protein FliS
MLYAAPTPQSGSNAARDVSLGVRVLGAGPHELVAILYDELLLALAIGAKAGARGNRSLLESRRERALTLLFALESGLDFARGGDLAAALARVYRESARIVRAAPHDQAAAEFTRAHDWLAEITEAWNAIR